MHLLLGVSVSGSGCFSTSLGSKHHLIPWSRGPSRLPRSDEFQPLFQHGPVQILSSWSSANETVSRETTSSVASSPHEQAVSPLEHTTNSMLPSWDVRDTRGRSAGLSVGLYLSTVHSDIPHYSPQPPASPRQLTPRQSNPRTGRPDLKRLTPQQLSSPAGVLQRSA